MGSLTVENAVVFIITNLCRIAGMDAEAKDRHSSKKPLNTIENVRCQHAIGQMSMISKL